MPITMSPKRRLWNFAENGERWFSDVPLLSAFLNVYTLLVPGNEAFYIRVLTESIRDCEDEEFRARIQHFIQQESLHGVAHRAAWRHLGLSSPAVRWFVKVTDLLLYRLMEPVEPQKFKLAIVAAIEHVNAVWAQFFLSRDLLRDSAPEMQSLFYWHFAEEIEHKAIASEALERKTQSYALRVLAGLFAFCSFYVLLAAGSLYVMAMTNTLFDKRNVYGLRFLFETGFIRFNLNQILRYCRRNFEPWSLDDAELVRDGLAYSAILK